MIKKSILYSIVIMHITQACDVAITINDDTLPNASTPLLTRKNPSLLKSFSKKFELRRNMITDTFQHILPSTITENIILPYVISTKQHTEQDIRRLSCKEGTLWLCSLVSAFVEFGTAVTVEWIPIKNKTPLWALLGAAGVTAGWNIYRNCSNYVSGKSLVEQLNHLRTYHYVARWLGSANIATLALGLIPAANGDVDTAQFTLALGAIFGTALDTVMPFENTKSLTKLYTSNDDDDTLTV